MPNLRTMTHDDLIAYAESLEEALRAAKEQLAPTVAFPPEWKLSPRHTVVLSSILAFAPRFATRERLMRAVYADYVNKEWPHENTLSVLVYQIRARLREAGVPVTIEHRQCQGYRLNTEDAHFLHDCLAQERPLALAA